MTERPCFLRAERRVEEKSLNDYSVQQGRFRLGRCKWLALWIALSLLIPQLLFATNRSQVQVHLGRKFFNPSIGQKMGITIATAKPQSVSVELVDRDGYRIRRLTKRAVETPATLTWNGRDDAGTVVPNEAYALRIRDGETGKLIFDPVSKPQGAMESISGVIYSRQAGVLSYKLPVASRVHLEVGQAETMKKGGPPEGPVLEILVDRKPRVAGRVVEDWSGWNPSKQIYIPDLPQFAVGVAATPLPEDSIITVGNRKETFLSYAAHIRGGRPHPRKLNNTMHQHHRGLNAFEDRTPKLSLSSVSEHGSGRWKLKRNRSLDFKAELDPSGALYFLTKTSELHVFLGIKEIYSKTCPSNPCVVRIPASQLQAGK
ncbi:MAG TPA: hypothetical protein VKA63_05010, partial [Candidatus Krumholzibacteria bacterium]|nr:hypothetical protein [Candidatus Krumholzibacteria bacterium]